MIKTIEEIITAVLGGEADSVEIQVLLDWYNASSDHPELFLQYESLWNALEIIGRKDEFNEKKAYQKFINYTREKDAKKQSMPWWGHLRRVAAIIVVTAGLAFFAGYYFQFLQKRSDTALCQIVTPKGSKAWIVLPDGTKVWLNAASRLKYPEHFTAGVRDVYLEGEGFFEVAKDKKHPFIVHTSKINIRAVGTAFNVKSYASEDIIQTTLVEGAVAIEKNDLVTKGTTPKTQPSGITILSPNQQATFYKSNSVIDVSSKTAATKNESPVVASIREKIVKKDSLLLDKLVDTELFTAWKEDKLVFDNEPFESLAIRLERRFDMKFHFMDEEIKGFRFTGHFNEISMEQLLEALKFASPIHFVINKKDIYISQKPLQVREKE